MALENGADDYITKSFDYEIIIAEILFSECIYQSIVFDLKSMRP